MPRPVSVRSGQVEFLKLNLEKREWRDAYQWLLALTWPEFAALIAGVYIVINLVFAEFYALGGECIAGMTPGSYLEAFFFSVQTLATVGYGHWYPQTLYGHLVTTVEIINGMFGLAVMTGLIFVRFSRPAARILFSKPLVIGTLNGRPTLMLRVGNLRAQSMVEAEFRIMFTRDEPILEGDTFRHFYNLKQQMGTQRCPTSKSHSPLRLHFELSSSSVSPTASLTLPTKAHAASLDNSWDTSARARRLSVSLPDSGNYLATRCVPFAVTSAIKRASTGWLRSSVTL